MQPSDIIRMAREAGLMDWNGQCVLTDGQLERFFHLAAAAGANAALEAAARQALERLRKYHHGHGFAEDAECIAALRAALKEKT